MSARRRAVKPASRSSLCAACGPEPTPAGGAHGGRPRVVALALLYRRAGAAVLTRSAASPDRDSEAAPAARLEGRAVPAAQRRPPRTQGRAEDEPPIAATGAPRRAEDEPHDRRDGGPRRRPKDEPTHRRAAEPEAGGDDEPRKGSRPEPHDSRYHEPTPSPSLRLLRPEPAPPLRLAPLSPAPNAEPSSRSATSEHP